uniref:DUF4777 domain-containing protein n=1 Tax=Glossina austeni TaxID=7395 RepID=A0A1A9VDI4_GLOAU
MPFVSSKLLLDAFKNIREPASIEEVFEYFYYGHPELSNHIADALDAGVRYGYIKKIDESHYMLTDGAVHSINSDLSLSEQFKSRYLYYNVKKDDQKQSAEIKPSSTKKMAKQSSIETRGDESQIVSSKRGKRKNLTLDPNRIRRNRDHCRSRTGNILKTRKLYEIFLDYIYLHCRKAIKLIESLKIQFQ